MTKISIIEKRCCTCKKTRPTTDFYKATLKRDGYQDECKYCYAKRRGYRLRGPGNVLDLSTVKGFTEPIKLSYAAGFFDGEGCVHFRYNKAQNGKTYSTLHVSVGQSSRPVLEWLQEAYGGSIYTYKKGSNKRTKDFYQWSIVGSRAWKFLTDILPYLIVKREDAKERLKKWESRHERAA